MTAQLRSLVLRARDFDSRRDIPLAALGSALRRLDPAFSPRLAGREKLVDALRLIPEVGDVVVGESGHPFFRYADESSTDGPSDPRVVIDRDLWQSATVFDRTAGAPYLDLAAEAVLPGSPATDLRVAEEPERYVPVPDLGRDFQGGLKRSFFETHADRFRAGGTLADPFAADAASLADFRSAARAAGLENEWTEFRSQAIRAELEGWMVEHGVNQRRFVHRVRTAPPFPRLATPGVSASAATGAERRALLALMTDEELAALQLPLDLVARLVQRLFPR